MVVVVGQNRSFNVSQLGVCSIVHRSTHNGHMVDGAITICQ
jgi:hypothetical protein